MKVVVNAQAARAVGEGNQQRVVDESCQGRAMRRRTDRQKKREIDEKSKYMNTNRHNYLNAPITNARTCIHADIHVHASTNSVCVTRGRGRGDTRTWTRVTHVIRN
jgi:hypothetical protein